MNKRGISAIVAVVMTILITVSGVVIIWSAIIPMVKNGFDEINTDVDLRIVSSDGYTIWDDESRLLMMQISRGTDESDLIGVDVVFSLDGNSIRHYVEEIPGTNSKKVYYINLSNYSGDLSSIGIAPVFKGGKIGNVASKMYVENIPSEDIVALINSGKISAGSFVGLNGGFGTGLFDDGTCFPDCDGKDCGDDGCGGSCGSCNSGYSCNSGSCVEEGAPFDCTEGVNCFYLDPTCGSDSDFGTFAAPWKTIVYAEANALPGSMVYLKTGNYGEVNITQQEPDRTSWDDALTFASADGASPVIERLFIEALRTDTAVDRYLIFDGLTFAYPNEDNDYIAPGTNVIDSESDSYLKFLNCDISSTLGVDDEGRYWQNKSIEAGIRIGRTNYGGISNVLVDNCTIHNMGLAGISIQGVSGENMIFTNNNIYHIGHAEFKADGKPSSPILIQGNELHDQIEVRVIANTGTHHASSIYIATNNINIRNNIIRGGGSTSPITAYQEIMDGGVYFKNGELDDVGHPFVSVEPGELGEAVTQDFTGAKGWVGSVKEENDSEWTLRIYRDQEINLFDEEHNIISDADSLAIYAPGEFVYSPRPYGGYQNITIENNLIYDSRTSYVNNFQDIGKNFKFNHNTLIGSHTTDFGGKYYANAFRTNPPLGGGDYPNTIEINNNIFVGYASGIALDNIVNNNIFYSYYIDPIHKDQSWMDSNFPSNLVYNWNQGEEGQEEFGTAPPGEYTGSMFVGSDLFREYSYTRTVGSLPSHAQNLNDAYYPRMGSDACSGGDNPLSLQTGEYVGAFDCVPCQSGETFSCMNNLLDGVCKVGERTCNSGTGIFGDCVPDISPGSQTEICDNNLDDDCDGDADCVDEDCSSDSACDGIQNLVFYLPFDGDSVDSINDIVGVWVRGGEAYSAGKVGQAGVFDGSSYINFGVHSEHEGMDELTLMAWVNSKGSPLLFDQNIISKGNDAYRLMLKGDNKLSFYLNTELNTFSKTSSSALNLNEWNHVALVYNGTDVLLYNNANLLNQWVPSGGAIDSPAKALLIGSYTGTNQYFNGSMDELRIYDKALTVAEIEDIYCDQGGDGC